MKLLVIGHALIADSNRKFWGTLADLSSSEVDLVVPADWSSNLKPQISFSPNPSMDSGIRRIHPLRVWNKGNGSFFFFDPIKLFRILREEKYDAVYLNQETWALATLWLITVKLFTRNRSTRLFLCVAQNLKKQKLAFLHPYERFISKFVEGFLYCSEEVREVIEWKGITKPCSYFPLPFDEKTYEVRLSRPAPMSFKLGYLGRLSEDKGLLVLLKALDELNEAELKYPLIVGGAGPLEAEIKKRSYVTYLGLIPHSEAHAFYEKIDCFVLPSQSRPHWKEQFGRVIVEAFGAGRPVIGSSSGSIPEVLGKLNWHWVFQEDSPEDLKDLIVRLHEHLQSPEGASELHRSVELNYGQFSQKRVAKTLIETINGKLG